MSPGNRGLFILATKSALILSSHLIYHILLVVSISSGLPLQYGHLVVQAQVPAVGLLTLLPAAKLSHTPDSAVTAFPYAAPSCLLPVV